MTSDIALFRTRLRSYTFYDRREQFVRTQSTFQEWVLIGVEIGSFDYEVGGERGHAVPGDLVLARPDQSPWRNATATPFTYHVLQWTFEDDLNATAWTSRKWPVRDVSRLLADYALLRPLHGRSDDYARRRTENLLEDILLLAWETHHTTPEVNDPTMREAARLLRERAESAFSMAEISGAVGLKPVQFTRRFRKAHGVTPIEYLTQLRLETALRLLIESDATLDEIAKHCGWSSGYYLSDVFKNTFGIAPGQFRRLHRV